MTRDVSVVVPGLEVMDMLMDKVRPIKPGNGTMTQPAIITLLLSDGKLLEGAVVVEVLIDYSEEF